MGRSSSFPRRTRPFLRHLRAPRVLLRLLRPTSGRNTRRAATRAACDACNARHAPPSPFRCERGSPFATRFTRGRLERDEGCFEPDGPSDRTRTHLPFEERGGWIPGDEAHACDASVGRETTKRSAGGVHHAPRTHPHGRKATKARARRAPGRSQPLHNRWRPKGRLSLSGCPWREGSDRHRDLYRKDIDTFACEGTGSFPFDRGSSSLSIGSKSPFRLGNNPPFFSFRNGEDGFLPPSSEAEERVQDLDRKGPRSRSNRRRISMTGSRSFDPSPSKLSIPLGRRYRPKGRRYRWRGGRYRWRGESGRTRVRITLARRHGVARRGDGAQVGREPAVPARKVRRRREQVQPSLGRRRHPWTRRTRRSFDPRQLELDPLEDGHGHVGRERRTSCATCGSQVVQRIHARRRRMDRHGKASRCNTCVPNRTELGSTRSRCKTSHGRANGTHTTRNATTSTWTVASRTTWCHTWICSAGATTWHGSQRSGTSQRFLSKPLADRSLACTLQRLQILLLLHLLRSMLKLHPPKKSAVRRHGKVHLLCRIHALQWEGACGERNREADVRAHAGIRTLLLHDEKKQQWDEFQPWEGGRAPSFGNAWKRKWCDQMSEREGRSRWTDRMHTAIAVWRIVVSFLLPLLRNLVLLRQLCGFHQVPFAR